MALNQDSKQEFVKKCQKLFSVNFLIQKRMFVAIKEFIWLDISQNMWIERENWNNFWKIVKF